jgi:ATP-dependent protease ClpP protease subunit
MQVRLQAEDETVADIHIIDVIGDWVDDWIKDWLGTDTPVTAKQFVDELAKLPPSVKTLRVHVNSPGGDVFGAVNIANALRAERAKGRTVETIVDGLAASAASLIVMAGEPARISDNGLLMIHDPWTVAVGNAAEMRQAAADLDKFRDASLIPTYQWHTDLSAGEIAAMLAATTWMDADEALANGFADEKIEGLRAAASIDPRAAGKLKIPEKYADRVKALLRPEDEPKDGPKPAPAPTPTPAVADAAEVVRLCGESGLDLAFAQALIGEGLTLEAVRARASSEKQARAAAEARATEIRALCAKAKQDDLAAGYVSGGMTVEQVRDHLTKITAKLDKVEIDAGLDPDHGTKHKPAIDVVAVYAERNRLRLPAAKN